MARNDGWVRLYRSIVENPLWMEEPFTKAQAWVDLILMANYEKMKTKKGDDVDIGSFVTSYSILADRWKWSIGKVRRFLSRLSGTDMITVTGTQSGTLVSLVNYDKYQGRRHTNEHGSRHTNEHADGIPVRREEYKEGKNTRAARPHNPTMAEKMAAIEERRQRLIREEQERLKGEQNDGD